MAVSTEETVRFEFHGFDPGDTDEVDRLADQLRAEGADANITGVDNGGVGDAALIPVIIGALALVKLAHALKNFLDDLKVGIVIDARSETVVTTKDPNLARGTVIMVSKDGERVELEQPDKETIADGVLAAHAA